MSNKLQVKIKSATRTHFDGEAFSITSYNDTGVFDVLPQHANFITVIKDRVIVNKGMKDQVEVRVENGVLSVKGDRVNVYLGF
ncbi:MAG TPA: hypothetical protein VJG85_01280 [Patescibacteria group bacterium]|nr:hypothetical protein [Patescibacteria group bacterium]